MTAYARLTAHLISSGYAPDITNRRNGELRARCPAHLGESADSLSVVACTDKVLIRCHRGCDTAAVVDALGLTLADLYDTPIAPSTPNVWVGAMRTVDLPPTVRLIAYVMASYATGATGGDIRPGVARISWETGLSDATVRRALAALRDGGYLTITARGDRRHGQADTYRLSLPAGYVPASGRTIAAELAEIRDRERGRHGGRHAG